ncbi:GNAT family N-acetyltransferase [Salinispirillum marinum]|uniref:GNAT family N-acetyltransferase n=2 Tax=Saccharospirillaceae TaxID=255527 RepID=A0ABV8BDG6_9GAMM
MVDVGDIQLRPAVIADRRQIFEALARSDLTDVLLSHPSQLYTPLLSYEDFCSDYQDHYFDGSRPELGRCFIIEHAGEAVGQVSYNDVDPASGFVELDIWMFGSQFAGKGFGTRALDALCRHLAVSLGIERFFMQPSASNERAVRSYRKAGFREATAGELAILKGISSPDAPDPFYMVRC